MAECDDCQQEMTPGTTCTATTYDDFPDGVIRNRVPYDRGEPGNCGDCNTPDGGLHHPGCDMERCPACKGQVIACDCWGDEDDWPTA